MSRNHQIALPIFLVAFALGGCDCGNELSNLTPGAFVSPETLDMGERPVNIVSSQSVVLGNDGTATYTIFGTEIIPLDEAGQAAFGGDFLDVSGTPFGVVTPERVLPEQTEEAFIEITAPAQGRFGATVLIKTDDAENPELRVDVLAIGGPPRILANPNPVEFGVVNQGPGAEVAVTLSNSGFDVLTITNISVESEDGSFSLAEGSRTEGAASVGDSISVNVRLDPQGEIVGERTGTLVVESNAQGNEVLRIPLIGEVNLAPRADAVELITRQRVYKASLQSEVIVDGSDTVDPEGTPVTFTWTLQTKPENSIAFLLGARTEEACVSDDDCNVEERFRCVPQADDFACRQVAQTRLVPDLVGRYEVLLRATDVQGAYSEALVEILPRDLALVLKWSTAEDAECQSRSLEECEELPPAERRRVCCGQSDLDIHLVKPEGTLGDYGTCPAECLVEEDGVPVNRCFEPGNEFVETCRQSGSDAAYANRYPEWGNAGREDDPRLDLDDVRGDGPEAITLNNPEDGVYTAYVHYCTDRLAGSGGEPVLATLEVYVEGVLTETTAPQRIGSQGEAWTAMSLIRNQGAWDLVAVPDIFAPNVPDNLCEQ